MHLDPGICSDKRIHDRRLIHNFEVVLKHRENDYEKFVCKNLCLVNMFVLYCIVLID